jgi:hypothetical protein
MRGDQQLWQQILDAQKEVGDLDAAYKASIADPPRGEAFDKGVLNRLTVAKLKLLRLQSEWGRRTNRR